MSSSSPAGVRCISFSEWRRGGVTYCSYGSAVSRLLRNTARLLDSVLERRVRTGELSRVGVRFRLGERVRAGEPNQPDQPVRAEDRWRGGERGRASPARGRRTCLPSPPREEEVRAGPPVLRRGLEVRAGGEISDLDEARPALGALLLLVLRLCL